MTIEKSSCQNCKHYSQGVGAVLNNGTIWKWENCDKNWGKKQPFIGVLKNICELHLRIKVDAQSTL